MKKDQMRGLGRKHGKEQKCAYIILALKARQQGDKTKMNLKHGVVWIQRGMRSNGGLLRRQI
jgi:hypothetical protein